MIEFDQVQPQLAALLRAYVVANPSVEGLPVIEDLGTEQNESDIETALERQACYAAVTVPIRGKTLDLKGGRALLDVEVLVLLAVNSERNDAEKNEHALGIGIYTLVKAAKAAVLNPATPPTNPQDRFGLAENALQLDVLDAGIFRYQLNFTKRCVL